MDQLFCITWWQWCLVLDQGWQLCSSMRQLCSRHSIGVKQAVVICATGGSLDLPEQWRWCYCCSSCSLQQLASTARERLGWRRPHQACCNLRLIDECMESVETPIRSNTVAVKDVGCDVCLTLCLLIITKKTWKGWLLKEIQKTNSVCIHSLTWIALWCLQCFAMWIAICLFCKIFTYINLKWKYEIQVKVKI